MLRNRIIFAILWILSLVAVSFFGGPVSYGFFFLLTLVPVVSLFYLLMVFAFFRIYQEMDSKNLVANHTAPYYFILKNEFPFSFSGIRVRFFSSFSSLSDLDDGVEYELLPKTGVKKQTSMVCKYRGEYEVGIKTIELRDFFCLFRIRFHNKETLRVIVKPNIVTLPALNSINLADVMTREASLHPTRADVLVRGYVPGDDIRYIHWKESAKTGELMVRQMIGEEREGIGIVLCAARPSEDEMKYLPTENKMLEAAIALSLFFTGKNTPVHSYIAAVKPSKKTALKPAEFRAMYEWFAATEFRSDWTEVSCLTPVFSSPELYQLKTVFLILNELTPALGKGIARLRENGISVVVYLITSGTGKQKCPPELNLPGVDFLCISPDDNLEEVM